MKNNPIVYVMAGFLTGIIYVAACGGGSNSVAATIGNAIDVLFDNSSSGLSATNVQGAMDEMATKVTALSNQLKIGADLAADLVGNWAGTFCNEGDCQNISMTLNADGSFSCDDNVAFKDACNDPGATWAVLTRVLKVSYHSEMLGDRATIFNTTYASASTLEMSDGTQHLFSLTKSE